MCEQNLIFPFMRWNSNCETENGFAVAVGRGDGTGAWWTWSVALSFVVVSHFASLRSIKRHFLIVCKGFISLIYIINFNFPSMVVIIYIIYIIYYI